MKVKLRTRLIADIVLAVAGLVILYIWDWPNEVVGVVAVAWTLTDCSSMLLRRRGILP